MELIHFDQGSRSLGPVVGSYSAFEVAGHESEIWLVASAQVKHRSLLLMTLRQSSRPVFVRAEPQHLTA